MSALQLIPLIQTLGPRFVIPSVFLGPKVSQQIQENKVSEAAKTVAFSFFFVTAVVLFFKGDFLLSAIPTIAAASYYFLLHDPSTIAYRYIDWVFTTPLMLIALLMANNSNLVTIIGLLIADIAMIGSGYEGVISQNNIWFWAGMIAFIPIVYVLWNLKEKKHAVILTLVLWSLYPIVWYAKEENKIDSTKENVAYSIMDVIAKVGLVTLLKI